MIELIINNILKIIFIYILCSILLKKSSVTGVCMFVVTKKNIIIVVILIIAIVSGILFPILSATSTPMGLYTIVLDAGHGGKDGGCVGRTTGVTESELNLRYAKDLEGRLKDLGFKVVMTRKDMNGLYSPFATNKKKSEMQKRKDIIEKSKADLVVSIHMNSFPTKSLKGAQVFYQKGSENGQIFARTIQDVFLSTLPYAKKEVIGGDYFVLRCTDKPGVLVECGFLSSPEEEALLVSNEHMYKLNNALVSGILAFVGI